VESNPGRARRRWTLVAVAGAMTVLAACGGGGAKVSDAQRLDEQVGLDEDGIKLRQARAENLIRDCMKDQGFDYVPVDPNAQQAALVGAAGMSKEDFEKQYGYGITTLYEQRLAEAVGGPNEKIHAALGEAERKAYDRALHGDDPTATFAEALDSGDFSRLGGCIKVATDEVFGGPEVLQSLQSKLDDLDEKMLADSRMVKAVAAWSDCMRAAGYTDVSRPDEVDSVLKHKLEAIVGSPTGAVAPRSGSEPTYDRAALAALQREEVGMVTTDKECEKRYLADVEEKVAGEYETAFREENANLLAKVPQK
jgi:hypothetical protein